MFGLGCFMAMKKQNRLSLANSPYLLQHAENPVDWYEWGDEAIEKAKKENKPLLISIGYAACHWCHVMAAESFQDDTIAAYMNEHFVCVKVDREERPDIDQIYMDAAHMISGRGGWPLNAVALPDGRPFYAATYFPPHQWLDVLNQLNQVFTTDQPRVLKAAESITNGIAANPFTEVMADQELTVDLYHESFKNHIRNIDFELGGYKKSPKFMMPVGIEFFLQYYYFSHNPKALEAVETTLNAMARGGLNDQIGGGFARYSTDERWLVPHFEKMLYDNAQLISLYSKAFQVTKNLFYKETVEKTIAFVERELLDPCGGFYSSIDADSEHEEGKFYVFSQREIEAVLGNEAGALIADFYNIAEEGNWEHGKNILHFTEAKNIFANLHGLGTEEFEAVLTTANQKLFDYRSQRIRPGTDDKILCSWNALMISAYVNAFKAISDQKYLNAAIKSAYFVEQNLMKTDGSLYRVFKNGKAAIDGFLDDYALLTDAFIDLYQITFDKHWLDKSLQITEYVLAHFANQHQDMFYFTSDKACELAARKYEYSDNVIPASNSVFAHVLFKSGMLTSNAKYLSIAQKMVRKVIGETVEHGAYYANWAQLLGLFVFPKAEVAVVGHNAQALANKLQQTYYPSVIMAGGNSENLPILMNRLIPDKTMIYVCVDNVCNLAVENINDAQKLLERTM